MSAAAIQSRMTVEEYFRMEADSLERHEYRGGVAIAMAGTSYEHSHILSNFIRDIGNALRDRLCVVLEGNVRVKIPRKTYYYYPDASIVCGKPEFDPAGPARGTILNPLVVIEVLSDSTERFDRGEKFTDYRAIDSMREYVLVSQHTPRIEVFLRQDDGSWRFSVAEGLNASLRLASIDRDIPLSEIYAKVELPASEG